eukprot:TRINITY_DN592_c1_g1_i5.p1 TRINITY_DN592_c1_g1~~TRINITY_DN592_c1_g1_i5.p1  ORF type:complete len:816 (-),score=215.51 TRINITY_DN592_c1_g1_i5:626-3073(-)
MNETEHHTPQSTPVIKPLKLDKVRASTPSLARQTDRQINYARIRRVPGGRLDSPSAIHVRELMSEIFNPEKPTPTRTLTTIEDGEGGQTVIPRGAKLRTKKPSMQRLYREAIRMSVPEFSVEVNFRNELHKRFVENQKKDGSYLPPLPSDDEIHKNEDGDETHSTSESLSHSESSTLVSESMNDHHHHHHHHHITKASSPSSKNTSQLPSSNVSSSSISPLFFAPNKNSTTSTENILSPIAVADPSDYSPLSPRPNRPPPVPPDSKNTISTCSSESSLVNSTIYSPSVNDSPTTSFTSLSFNNGSEHNTPTQLSREIPRISSFSGSGGSTGSEVDNIYVNNTGGSSTTSSSSSSDPNLLSIVNSTSTSTSASSSSSSSYYRSNLPFTSESSLTKSESEGLEDSSTSSPLKTSENSRKNNNNNSSNSMFPIDVNVRKTVNLQNLNQNLVHGIELFNKKWKDGIKHFLEEKLVEPNILALAKFLLNYNDVLNKTELGEALYEYEGADLPSTSTSISTSPPSTASPTSVVVDSTNWRETIPKAKQKRLLTTYTCLFDFRECSLSNALRKYLCKFMLPGEAQKIDCFMEIFSNKYSEDNPGLFPNADIAFILSFSIIMLNTDLHNPAIAEKNKMTLEQFIKNNSKIWINGEDPPQQLLVSLYENIYNEEIQIRTAGDPTKKGWVKSIKAGQYEQTGKRWLCLIGNELRWYKSPTLGKGEVPALGKIELDYVNVSDEGSDKFCISSILPRNVEFQTFNDRGKSTVVEAIKLVIACENDQQAELWMNEVRANVTFEKVPDKIDKKVVKKLKGSKTKGKRIF